MSSFSNTIQQLKTVTPFHSRSKAVSSKYSLQLFKYFLSFLIYMVSKSTSLPVRLYWTSIYYGSKYVSSICLSGTFSLPSLPILCPGILQLYGLHPLNGLTKSKGRTVSDMYFQVTLTAWNIPSIVIVILPHTRYSPFYFTRTYRPSIPLNYLQFSYLRMREPFRSFPGEQSLVLLDVFLSVAK